MRDLTGGMPRGLRSRGRTRELGLLEPPNKGNGGRRGPYLTPSTRIIRHRVNTVGLPL